MSSTGKFEQLSYKLFEPSYHAQRPIIVDEELQSPGTVALVYEEEAAARANGGGLRGDSPTGLLPMSAYKPQPPQIHGFADSPYSQFSPQSYASQPTDHATPQQINSLAFASNSATGGVGGQYVSAAASTASPSSAGPGVAGFNVLSCQPSSGNCGTKVSLRVASQMDLTNALPYVYISFGEQKCAAEVCKEDDNSSNNSNGSGNGSNWIFSVTAAAPQFISTNCASPSNVPVTLFVDHPGSGSEGLGRVVRAGSFTYHHEDAHGHSGPLASGASDLGHGQQHQNDDSTHHKTQVPGHVDSQSPPPSLLPPPATHPHTHQRQHHQQSQQGHHQHQQQHQQQGQVQGQGQGPPHLTVRTSDTSSPIHHHHHDHHQSQQQHHQSHQQHPHHEAQHHSHPGHTHTETTTNTYGYSPTTVSPVEAHAVAAAAAAAEAEAAAAAVAVQAQAQAEQESQQNFVGSYGAAGNNDMLSAYRTRVSFNDPYRPSNLRSAGGGGVGGGPSGGWNPYGTSSGQDPTDRYDIVRDAALTHSHNSSLLGGRPGITNISPSPTTSQSSVPRLVRTSLIPSPVTNGGSHHHSHHHHTQHPGVGGMGGAGAGYSAPWAVYPSKAILQINGNLDSMTAGWTNEEWQNKRRIVLFRKKHHANIIDATFKAVPIADRPTNSICISCIYWAERNECFVTSVDTIHLLEQLLQAPSRFCVEEKNRIRRNLEGFKPITVSKQKAESEEFFKLIMGFGNPKPRNIEKDVKVFPWKILSAALKKIVSKYSQSPSTTMGGGGGHHPAAPPPPLHHLLTPVSLPTVSSYSGLPPTPVSATTATDPSMASGYVGMATSTTHVDASTGLPSPRSLPATSSWGTSTYGAPPPLPPTTRTLSPGGIGVVGGLKTHSPQPVSTASSGLRISTLPPTTTTALYDSRSAVTSSAAAYGASSSVGSAVSRWGDPYDVPVSATSAYSTAAPHHHSLHAHSHAHAHPSHVYSSAAYGTDAQRA